MGGEWRPFEATREAVRDASEFNRCNKHSDCEAADIEFKRQYPNGRNTGHGWRQTNATHCHTDDCEECFGC